MTTTPKMTESAARKSSANISNTCGPRSANYYSEPLVADHASMQYLWDIEGKKYLDFFGGIVTIVGRALQSQSHIQDQGAGR